MANVPFDPLTDIGNIAGFQSEFVGQGYSARQALQVFRGAGGTSGDARWFASYANVRASLANSDYNYALDPNQYPAGSDYSQWAAGRGGQYATSVAIQMIDKDTGLIGTHRYMHLTDTPHTPAEAMQAGIDLYGSDDNVEKYRQDVGGAYVVGIYQTTPYVGD